MTPIGMLRAITAAPTATQQAAAAVGMPHPLVPMSDSSSSGVFNSPAAGCGVTGDPAPATKTDAHESPAAGDIALPSTRLGRPPLLVTLGLDGELGEELRKYIRRQVLAHNRTREAGSYSLALRKAAALEIAPAAFRDWVAGRADRYSIPPSIREWIDVPAAVQRWHRNPTEAGLRGVYCPGSLRINHATGERLRAGERFSADDGSVNFVVFVDWPWGGDPCSDRYGVRVGRYQLLAMHDDATGFVPHFSWIARASDAYRAEDIATLLHHAFSTLGVWDTALFEGGSWRSHRVSELLRLSGVERDDAYEPNQKPVEGWWNRAWTALSSELPGQIGRFRGEEEAAAAMVERFRRGSEDPRKTLLSLPDAANVVARIVGQLNATEMDGGPMFGRWVPAERWQADLSVRPMRRLPASTEPLTRPERRELMVRRWSVHCEAMSPTGFPLKYEFFDEALISHEGKRVLVYFDPQDDPCTAAIYAADGRHLIAARATCISRAPALIRGAEGYKLDWDNGQIERARAAKAQARAAVRREHRTIAPDGKLDAWASDVRDARDRASAAMSRTSGALTAPAADPLATTPPESAPAASRLLPGRDSARGGSSSRTPARPVPTEDEAAADLARTEALERRAQSAGYIPLTVDPL